MNVQVTIRIDREALAEMAEVFREIIGVAPNRETGARSEPTVQAGPAVQQPIPVTQSVPVEQQPMPMPQTAPTAQPVPVAQPQITQAVPSVQQGGQAFSAQIAQKTQIPVQTMAGTAAPTQGLPTTAVAQEYTQDQMAIALTGLIDAGRRETVTQILGAFGVQALTQIPKERYPELVLKLREAGANI